MLQYYYSGIKLYIFCNFVVIMQSSFIQFFFYLAPLSSLPSIFSALLEDSLFWSSFPASEYLRSASRTLVGLLESSLFWSSFPASEYLRSASRTLVRLLWGLFILAVLPLLSSICAAPSRTPLSWIWVLAQGPSTWVNLLYLEYLRKELNHPSSLVILSTCAKSLKFADVIWQYPT